MRFANHTGPEQKFGLNFSLNHVNRNNLLIPLGGDLPPNPCLAFSVSPLAWKGRSSSRVAEGCDLRRTHPPWHRGHLGKWWVIWRPHTALRISQALYKAKGQAGEPDRSWRHWVAVLPLISTWLGLISLGEWACELRINLKCHEVFI